MSSPPSEAVAVGWEEAGAGWEVEAGAQAAGRASGSPALLVRISARSRA
jgi:hypothetical protein